MLNEIKFAKENGIELEVNVEDSKVIVFRKTDKAVFVITIEEAKELGLIKEEKNFKGEFFLNNKRFSNMDFETFEIEIEKFASEFHEKKQIKYGVVFDNRQDLIEFVDGDWEFVRLHRDTWVEKGKFKQVLIFRTNISKKSFFDNKNSVKIINKLLNKINR